ncbi:DUF4249 domain-containing protein [Flavihumibacter solisilvae]|uniref:DUF4249 domain-containing protein n=1 Tax=Flavihumibacter solisilvae TaxID=1349421 RepID=A0A0C1LJA2_9BACT|nr:DUF4249 domain-containing protein [Flavihumibacter solisilvae]KIC95468.1 hypothetical protein OI18_06180 [Flavihumibacter solisilvae]
MKNSFIAIVSLFFLVALSSCEKVVDLDAPKGEPLPYVDAWINDRPGTQTIRLLKSVPYLDNQAPTPVPDAQVSVTDLNTGQTFDFNYSNGSYIHQPSDDQPVGTVGHSYRLRIEWQGDVFEATDHLNRVTTVDSIAMEFREKDGEEKEGYYAELFARDIVGATDYSWIRTYRNGVINTHVSEMLAIDGSFEEDIADGFLFIPPLREGITSSEKPYQQGDEVKVLIRSLSKETHGFMELALEQINIGGLFAKVLVNVPGNLQNQNASSAKKIYGWFATVAEAEMSRKVE